MDHGTLMVVEAMAISKFKATCLAVLERVGRTGQGVLVTRRGAPIARVVPPSEPKAGTKQGFGCMAGTAQELEDITKPLGPASWNALR